MAPRTPKFYKNLNTNKIHTVGVFPAPARENHTQCGQEITTLTFKQLTPVQVRKAQPLDFCGRCEQLSRVER